MGPPDLLQLSPLAAPLDERRVDRNIVPHDAYHVAHDQRVTASGPHLGGG